MKVKWGIIALLMSAIFSVPFTNVYAFSSTDAPINKLQSGSFVITSDPQYPWTDKTDNNESESQSEKEKRSEQLIKEQYGSIDDYALSLNTNNAHDRLLAAALTPVLINGDMTAYGHGDKILGLFGAENQWGKMLELLQTLLGPVYPGLGNHDIQNNYNNCADNGCIYNSFYNYFNGVLGGVPTTNFDMKMGNPNASSSDPTQQYSGSFAYSTEIGPIHSIQLNNYPTMTFPNKTVSTKNGRITFTLESSLDWLEKDLQQATQAGKSIIINLHEPSGWGWNSDDYPKSKYPNLESGPNQRFINLLKTYNVKAVFAGHYHDKHGLYENDYKAYFGDVPVFLSGSAPNKTYLIAEYTLKELKVYAVKNNDWKNKTLLKTIPISNLVIQTKDKGYGQLYLKSVGGILEASINKPGFGISYEDKKWSILIDNKLAYTFSELTPVDEVATAINQLHLQVNNNFTLQGF